MATVKYIEEQDAKGQVKKVYDDIKQVFGLTFVPNLFKAMAHQGRPGARNSMAELLSRRH